MSTIMTEKEIRKKIGFDGPCCLDCHNGECEEVSFLVTEVEPHTDLYAHICCTVHAAYKKATGTELNPKEFHKESSKNRTTTKF